MFAAISQNFEIQHFKVSTSPCTLSFKAPRSRPALPECFLFESRPERRARRQGDVTAEAMADPLFRTQMLGEILSDLQAASRAGYARSYTLRSRAVCTYIIEAYTHTHTRCAAARASDTDVYHRRTALRRQTPMSVSRREGSAARSRTPRPPFLPCAPPTGRPNASCPRRSCIRS